MKKISLTLKPFLSSCGGVFQQSPCFCFTYSDCVVCCKLKHSSFSLERGEKRGRGLERKSCPLQCNCWPKKKHLYIFFLVQLLKCKTFPVTPWEVSFLCFLFFFFFVFLFIFMDFTPHRINASFENIQSKRRSCFFNVLSISFLCFFFLFSTFCFSALAWPSTSSVY